MRSSGAPVSYAAGCPRAFAARCPLNAGVSLPTQVALNAKLARRSPLVGLTVFGYGVPFLPAVRGVNPTQNEWDYPIIGISWANL